MIVCKFSFSKLIDPLKCQLTSVNRIRDDVNDKVDRRRFCRKPLETENLAATSHTVFLLIISYNISDR